MKMTETLVNTIIRLRLKEAFNNDCLKNMAKCTLLEDVNTYGQRDCRRSRKHSDTARIMSVGYDDGLYIANELIQNDSYNLESLIAKVQKLPNSYGVVIMGSAYTTGFMNGLFASASENHILLKKWRKALAKEMETVS